MSVRKAHNAGRNHERNVLDYYQRMMPLSTNSIWTSFLAILKEQRICGSSSSEKHGATPINDGTNANLSSSKPNRNRPLKSPIRNRLHHKLLRRRRPSRRKPHARITRRRTTATARNARPRISTATIWISRYFFPLSRRELPPPVGVYVIIMSERKE